MDFCYFTALEHGELQYSKSQAEDNSYLDVEKIVN